MIVECATTCRRAPSRSSFTDIEGSTILLGDVGTDAYAVALA